MKESTALDAAQELLNYRKVSIFSSEIFLLMKFEKIIDVIMSFLKENFSCQHIGFVPVKSGTPTKQITYPSGEVTECSPEIEKFLSLQVANQKTVSHFEVTRATGGVEKKDLVSTLLLYSRSELVGVLVIDEGSAFVQAIKDPHKKHLLNLFLRQAASALRGAIDTNLYFADKLNQTMVIEKERLIHVNQKLQEATRAKSEFLARMSHEMRTPLNVILGLIDTVAEKIRDEEGIELVNIMKNSSSALLGIINDVLDISKIEANELKLDVERINFYPFIEQTLQVFQEKAKKKSIDLSFHIDPQVPPYVLGDSLRLRQILFNLTSNALKFTDQGRIHLNILINRKNGHIIFELSDTGIGLTEEQMVNIFEPFTQAEQGTTRNYGGTGLGLSITKRLVNLMHGDIFVRKNCKEEGGSIFFFDCELPADTRPKVRKSDKKYEEEFFKKPIKVLVVDDAIDNQLVVRLFLKKTNFQLTFANNGKEALDLYQRRKYDIVFMDMQMPVMGGNESTKEIRSFENKQNSKHTPIIAFTADAIVEHAGEMLRAGCDEVLTKPFRKEQVFDCIYRWTQTSCG